MYLYGVSYTPVQVYPYIDNLDLPDYVIRHMKENRKGVNDLIEYLKNGDAKMQKGSEKRLLDAAQVRPVPHFFVVAIFHGQ